MNSSSSSLRILDILKFAVPSFLGLFIFLFPVQDQEGHSTITIALLIKKFKAILGSSATDIVCFLIVLTSLVSIVFAVIKPKFVKQSEFLRELFLLPKYWLFARIIGAFFVSFLCFGIDLNKFFSFFIDANEVGLDLNNIYAKQAQEILSICVMLFCTFILAGLFLPLLLEFGLIDFIGVKSQKVMRKIFNLPGFSSVGCLTSWFGDGSLGIIITDRQYKNNQYTEREAAVVATNFSAVSITFALIVLANVSLDYMFMEFYLTVCLTGFVAAIIVPRLPPLSSKKDIYFDGTSLQDAVKTETNIDSSFNHALQQAVAKSSNIDSVAKVFAVSIKNAIAMILSVLPIVMAIGTLSSIIASTTDIFEIIGYPFYYILDLINFPEAKATASVVMLGFADMLLPSMLVGDINSDMVRFVIACLSVTQLVYLSEVGVLILSSSIPLSLIDLFCIFIIRTIICFPIIYVCAYFIF